VVEKSEMAEAEWRNGHQSCLARCRISALKSPVPALLTIGSVVY
jgi:hypothetical protein